MMEIIEQILNTLDTGSGFWNPLVWGTIILIAFIIGYTIRSFGKIGYKKGTEQTKPFLSGNIEGDKEKSHIKASNLYWGFTESLKGVYSSLTKIHNGNINDYILWFIVIMGIFFIVLVGVF